MADKLPSTTNSLRRLLAESAADRLLRDAAGTPFSRALEASLHSPMSRALENLSDRYMTWALQAAMGSPMLRAFEESSRKHEELLRDLTAVKFFDLPKVPNFLHGILDTNRAFDKQLREMSEATRMFEEMGRSFALATDALRSQSELARQFESLTSSMTLSPPPALLSGLLEVDDYARQAAQEAEGHLAAILEDVQGEMRGSASAPVESSSAPPVPVVIRTGVDWIDRLPPVVQFLVIYLILELVGQLVVAGFQELLLRESADKPLPVVIQQYYEAPERAPVGRLRCVLGDSLRVHEAPTLTSKTIGHLEKSQGVELVREEGDSSLVRYYPKGSEEIASGWVSSIYLAPVICSE